MTPSAPASVERAAPPDSDRVDDFQRTQASPPPAPVGEPSKTSAALQCLGAQRSFAVSSAKAVQRITEDTRALVRIPSQGGIDDPAPICVALEAMVRRAGLVPSRLLDPDGRSVGVVAEVYGERPGPTYVLDAVVDTAPVGDPSRWKHEPFSGHVEGGRMFGRGVADSKVAAAMFIELGRELKDRASSMAGRVILFFDAAEHTGKFEGVRALLARYARLDGVVIGYPGDEALNVGSRGFCRSRLRAALERPGDPWAVRSALLACGQAPLPSVLDPAFPLGPKLTVTAARTEPGPAVHLDPPAESFELHVTGAAHHSGSSKEGGVNAALKCAQVLAALAELGAVVSGVEGGRGYSLVPDAVTLRVAVPGGDARARVEAALAAADRAMPAGAPSRVLKAAPVQAPVVVAGLVELNVDLRTTPSFGEVEARAHLKHAFAGPWTTSIVDEEAWPAFALAEHDPLRRAMEHGVSDGGQDTVPSRISGPSNVGNLLASRGIPATTGYGVAFSAMHGTDESIELSSIGKALDRHRRAVFELMAIRAD